jgi:hypothetical protein
VPVCGAISFTIQQTSLNTVTGSGIASVGNTAVRVWQIMRANRTLALHTTGGCNISSTVIIQAQEQFAAERGLIVSADDKVSTSTLFPGQVNENTNVHEVRTLKSLSPA